MTHATSKASKIFWQHFSFPFDAHHHLPYILHFAAAFSKACSERPHQCTHIHTKASKMFQIQVTIQAAEFSVLFSCDYRIMHTHTDTLTRTMFTRRKESEHLHSQTHQTHTHVLNNNDGTELVTHGYGIFSV